MSSNVTLKASPREEKGKGAARKLRSSGRVPAVVYGGDADTLSLSVDSNEAYNLFQRISVENTIVDLSVEGQKKPIQTLVREIQAHPYRPELVHIDFWRVTKGVAIEVEIPVHLEGTPVGVKDQGGILDQVIHTLTIRSIPSKIPESIIVDISGLELNQSLHVSGMDLDPEMQVLTDPERTVATVYAPKAEIVEAGEMEEAPEPELVGAEDEAVGESGEED